MDWNNLNSKKLIVSMTLIAATVLLALLDALNPVVGSIFTGIGVMHPAAQSYADSKAAQSYADSNRDA